MMNSLGNINLKHKKVNNEGTKINSYSSSQIAISLNLTHR